MHSSREIFTVAKWTDQVLLGLVYHVQIKGALIRTFMVITSYNFYGVQRKMISVDNVFVFLRLLFFALLLLYET